MGIFVLNSFSYTSADGFGPFLVFRSIEHPCFTASLWSLSHCPYRLSSHPLPHRSLELELLPWSWNHRCVFIDLYHVGSQHLNIRRLHFKTESFPPSFKSNHLKTNDSYSSMDIVGWSLLVLTPFLWVWTLQIIIFLKTCYSFPSVPPHSCYSFSLDLRQDILRLSSWTPWLPKFMTIFKRTIYLL